MELRLAPLLRILICLSVIAAGSKVRCQDAVVPGRIPGQDYSVSPSDMLPQPDVLPQTAPYDRLAPPASAIQQASAFSPSCVSSCVPSCIPSCYNFCCGNCWTVSADLMIMKHESPFPQTLLSQGATPLLNATDLDFQHELGPRLSLIRNNVLGSDCDLELAYFGIDGWNATAAFPNANIYNLAIDRNNPAFPLILNANALFSYGSKLYSSELNVRRQIHDSIVMIAGFRWVEYSEQYVVSGTVGAGPTPYSHMVDTNNHLYGFQLGADVALLQIGSLTVESVVKAGVFHNSADQASSFSLLNAAAGRHCGQHLIPW